MAKKMRAKMRITSVTALGAEAESLVFNGVAKDGPYPSDGSDEDNSFAKFSPSVTLTMTIANPALLDAQKAGDVFYVDFIPVENEEPKPVDKAKPTG